MNDNLKCQMSFPRQTQLKAHIHAKHGPVRATSPEQKNPKRKISASQSNPGGKQM